MSIVNMIQRNERDTVLCDALCKSLADTSVVSINVRTTNYIFPKGPMPVKVISLQLPGMSCFEALCKKLWTVVKNILEFLGFNLSKQTVNKDLLIDCVLEINQEPNRKELFRAECKKIEGTKVHIFVARENPRLDRVINIV